jgi:hypothetical protein
MKNKGFTTLALAMIILTGCQSENNFQVNPGYEGDVYVINKKTGNLWYLDKKARSTEVTNLGRPDSLASAPGKEGKIIHN